MKRTGLGLLFAGMIMFAACGKPSEEMIQEVQEAYAGLVSSHNQAVEIYASLEDDSYSAELDEMAEILQELGTQDAKNMTQEELESVLLQLQEQQDRCEEIQESINQMASEVQIPKEELIAVPVTFRNNTGVKLFQLYLYKASDEEKGENLVEDIGYLDGYQTRNILNLYMTDDERLWILEAIDEEGNTIEYGEIDFDGFGEEGATIRMEYSFDTMEGWIEMD